MNVFVETQEATSFSIEVDIFDTVLQIKENVQKHQGIPIHRQTLVFNGQVLRDDGDVVTWELLENPRLQLLVTPEHDQPQVNIAQTFPSKKIQLSIKIGLSSEAPVPLEMGVNETVLQLKEKIHAMQFSVPAAKMLVAQSSGVELRDHRHLRDYGLKDNTEILITTRPSTSSSGTAPAATAAAAGSKRLKVTVLTRSGAKIPVEVNASDNVGELRNELQKLQQSPQESYFFIHKQNVMEEDQSFRWHQVSQDDTIEIFPGQLSERSEEIVGRRRR